MGRLSGGAVVRHVSAAVLHGLPVWSRVALARAGLPPPTSQWPVLDGQGHLIGRVDFGWPEFGVVGEFDGRVKYGRLLRPGQDAGDAVYAEKRREDLLRAHGLTVVRWSWPDLDDFNPIATRLRRALRSSVHR